MIKIKVDGVERILLNIKKDTCVICGKPIKDSRYEWTMAYGEAKLDCCNTNYQLKYGEVDKKENLNLWKYSNKIKNGYIGVRIKSEYIMPIKQAMEQLKSRKVTKKVLKLAKKILEDSKDRRLG